MDKSLDDQPWVKALAMYKKNAELRPGDIKREKDYIKEKVFNHLFHYSESKSVLNHRLVCGDLKFHVELKCHELEPSEVCTYIENILKSYFDAKGYITLSCSVKTYEREPV
jgi:CRISPR/Cas system CMR-associated protein Cmr3 (group 5 of RAMP superfamily)